MINGITICLNKVDFIFITILLFRIQWSLDSAGINYDDSLKYLSYENKINEKKIKQQ